MLTSLYVKNLALIDEIEVDFQSGLNILTGETGAGKSIILGSIDLALGGKYNADMLRSGAPFGLVELTFVIEQEGICKKLEGLGVFTEDKQLTLSRRLMDGRSISKINGETVTKNLLAQVAELLINIHGQHEHQSLLSKRNHLALLDLYGGNVITQLKSEVAECYKNFRGIAKELSEAKMDDSERKKELAFLSFEVNEIETAALQEEEDIRLEEEYQHMQAGRKLVESTSEAYQYTSGNPDSNASDLISRGVVALQDLQGFDENGNSLYQQLAEIDSLLNDFNRELASYEESLEFSEESFFTVENRLNEINHLKAKYGNSVTAILTYQETQQKRLLELENYEIFLAGLQERYQVAEQQLQAVAKQLSTARKKAAERFVKEIRQNLAELNFLEVRFEMAFTTVPSIGIQGSDEAEFLLSTNPGEPLKALADVASGGELSRVMLAIKTVLAEVDETLTLIFDEIDSGISGITAGKVAQKLHIIGEKRQVICITHLPQIAALADTHYLIEKQSDRKQTKTEIVMLDYEASIRELARILGGENITENLLISAREMKG